MYIFKRGGDGLYYYGARYLDPKYSRWLSGDPALGDYVPAAGSDPSKLAGMGGVYNTVNLHLYHYTRNNPVKYTDPDGKITAVANNNLLNILQQAEGAVEAVGTAATAIMSSPVGMAAGIVIVTGAAVMFVDQHYLDGAIRNKLADGVDFVADKTKEAASWVSGKAKEAGTWISNKAMQLGSTIKDKWDNIFNTQDKKHTPDQQALNDLAKEAKRRGITNEDADTLLDWENEVDPNNEKGLRGHDDRGTDHWTGGDHIHVGGQDHIPVVEE